MSDITIALSSTRHIILTDMPELYSMDIPICHALMGMGMFGFDADLEREEHQMALVCKSMAKTVAISKPRVFIGEDPQDEMSALIEYTEERSTPRTESFFEQWEKYKKLLMEFQVVDLQGKTIFALRGLWDKDHWLGIDIYPESQIKVTRSEPGEVC